MKTGSAQEVNTLRLSSSDYLFQRGVIRLYRVDATAETRTESFAARTDMSDPEDQAHSLEQNTVYGLRLSLFGTYRCIFSNLEVLRLSDQKQFGIPFFTLPEFTLTEQDVQGDSATIHIMPGRVSKIVALDKQKKPIPWKKLIFTTTSMAITRTTDENGEILFLGNPTEFLIEFPRAGDEFSILITPL